MNSLIEYIQSPSAWIITAVFTGIIGQKWQKWGQKMGSGLEI